MISIRDSLEGLEKVHRERDTAVECYVMTLKSMARYTIELEPAITEPQRQYLNALAEEAATGQLGFLVESQATVRGLLRDYRDKASEFMKGLREELDGVSRAMEQVLGSLAQTDGEHETRLRRAQARIRELALSAGPPLRDDLAAAMDTIDSSLEAIRKDHQLTVSQLRVEMSVLHKRIDTLEAAASLDQLTELFNRREIEERIRAGPGTGSVLLAKVSGFRLAEVHFRKEVASELIAAFTKRLRNSLPGEALIGRWAHEEFAAVLPIPVTEAGVLAKRLAEQLSGAYACLMSGKTVNPQLQVSVAVVDSDGVQPDRILQRIGGFLSA